MFPVICKKTPAMWHVGLWGQNASSSHAMNVSVSRCVLHTLKSTTDLERMRLRGLSGARDEFHLAAIVQNLKSFAPFHRSTR